MESVWLDFIGAEVGYRQGRYSGRYLKAGAGEPLVLLHGQGGHIENFSRNVRALSRLFTVYVIDAAWHGLGPQPSVDPELIPTFVDQVLLFLDSHAIQKAHILGQSMGGWTALRLASDHPERVNRLVVVTPQGFEVPADEDALFEAVPGKDFRDSQLSFLANPTLENIQARMAALVYKEKIPEELVAVRARFYRDPVTNEALQAVVRSYMGGSDSPPRRHIVRQDDLARITAPCLVYWGERNPGPPDAGERLALAIPGARYHCAKDTGHWAQFENHEEHNAVVLEFLRHG